MHEAGVNSVPLSLAQAAALAELVELEARWENLRHQPTAKGGLLPRDALVRKQMAHDAFQAKLLAYNRRNWWRRHPYRWSSSSRGRRLSCR